MAGYTFITKRIDSSICVASGMMPLMGGAMKDAEPTHVTYFVDITYIIASVGFTWILFENALSILPSSELSWHLRKPER